MTAPATLNPYAPENVPVETPFIEEDTKKEKTDTAGTFMVLGIIIFIAIIIVEAFFLVQSGKITPKEPSYTGPSLQQ